MITMQTLRNKWRVNNDHSKQNQNIKDGIKAENGKKTPHSQESDKSNEDSPQEKGSS